MAKAQSLSIVIPVHNEEDHLHTCLSSIANQTVLPDEVIVVDNNSTDRSVLVAEMFPFVKIVKESSQGISYARNAGFDAANSGLIGRIDADTVLPENWVENVLEIYRDKQNFALTGGGYFYNVPFFRLNGLILGQLAFRVNRFILGHYILWGSNMVLPRNSWHRVKTAVCTHDNSIHEDLDLAIHLHQYNVDIRYEERLRVGVKMKRVYSSDSTIHRQRMNMWPDTLYAHGFKRAWLGSVGAYILYQGRHVVRASDAVAKTFRASRARLYSAWKINL